MPSNNFQYIDLRKNFSITPGDVVVYDLDAINESIMNILGTPRYSRMFNRGFGSYLDSALFELIDEDTADEILLSIVQVLSQWEPRVEVNLKDSFVKPDYDNNQYNVRIVYIVKIANLVGTLNTVLKAT